ncbi:PQQ-dependent oxidoreductase, gdhB family [Caenispirillum salinarum AK4]|uniref:PQQ-dependent oxidoreductase, gdhB family n=1 Tax=Caenispirillum salinarum AK4 TaxID=1238182 RepID=K9GQ95_9PROT|nr:PQQ-dependent sugar dehydrogenase [Caenispirillum salinarum]EKV26909.1 PQQ-dependent oxidoreductase, gdhB family [Caenispirillum salinarum AK4]
MRGVLLGALMLLVAPAARAADAFPDSVDAFHGTLGLEVLTDQLHYPWSVVFLPDGDMLVTEKHPGRLRRVAMDGTVGPALAGLPPIYAEGNGGLLGLALDPEFAANRRIYFAYSEAGEGTGTWGNNADETQEAGLNVARAVLHEDRVSDVEVIFRQAPKVADVRDFGGRLAFAPDGTLFIGTGDRFLQAGVQDLSTTVGKLIRINPDGSVPADNPFVGRTDAEPAIWSFGHRNILGLAVHPDTGAVWELELGPLGGDELNIPAAGENHGWPLVSWGRHYEGQAIPSPSTRPDLADAVFHWTPVISPSGMTFYTGTGGGIADWAGNLLLGGLSSESLTRLTLSDARVVGDERIYLGTRIRDVAEGPDGAVYLLTDESDGKIVRVTMQERAAKTLE